MNTNRHESAARKHSYRVGIGRLGLRRLVRRALALFFWGLGAALAEAAVPEDFTRFVVPGDQQQMDSLRQMFWQHYESAGPLIPLWDEWMPNATLWPARGTGPGLSAMRARWAAALSSRVMNEEGYIHTQQHDGLGHAEGWPFPLWTQAGGIGWHFRGTGVPGYDAPPATPEGWLLRGAAAGGVNDRGWVLSLTEPAAHVQTPAIAVAAGKAPWLRLNWWAAGLDKSRCYLEWTTQDQPEFTPDRRVFFQPAVAGVEPPTATETRTMIPVYRHAGWKGTITGLRIGFDNAQPGQVIVKSFHTASDTRHNINNLNFIRGCHDYFLWSLDRDFLRGQIGRIRRAIRFVDCEFQTRDKKCVYTTWPGHEGRSGVRWIDGRKVVIPGEGVGSNYWDLLPFGGEDSLATVYYYDTLHDLAELEEAIAAHPEWEIAQQAAYDPADLRRQAQEVKDHGGRRFWNETTGRFGTRDLDGNLYDYGFTFLNNEAVVFDFATAEQARSIHTWLSGARTVAGDTATGADIYHWQFGPRSTTRRNIDYYFWGWSAPESVPWGNQVQDGGAVLGWTYYDLMARLQTAGADDAATRLAAVIKWFDATQAEGGYRNYYGKDATRGTLQGANVAGGLGMDNEFFESVLVPQVMLYGFLGFRPTVDGFALSPRLPTAWPELTVTRIHLHDHVLDITATRQGEVKISGNGPASTPLGVQIPADFRLRPAEGLTVRIMKAPR